MHDCISGVGQQGAWQRPMSAQGGGCGVRPTVHQMPSYLLQAATMLLVRGNNSLPLP